MNVGQVRVARARKAFVVKQVSFVVKLCVNPCPNAFTLSAHVLGPVSVTHQTIYDEK